MFFDYQVKKRSLASLLVNFRMKDDAAGEVPVAFVVKSKDSNITEDEIKEYIKKQVIPL